MGYNLGSSFYSQYPVYNTGIKIIYQINIILKRRIIMAAGSNVVLCPKFGKANERDLNEMGIPFPGDFWEKDGLKYFIYHDKIGHLMRFNQLDNEPVTEDMIDGENGWTRTYSSRETKSYLLEKEVEVSRRKAELHCI